MAESPRTVEELIDTVSAQAEAEAWFAEWLRTKPFNVRELPESIPTQDGTQVYHLRRIAQESFCAGYRLGRADKVIRAST